MEQHLFNTLQDNLRTFIKQSAGPSTITPEFTFDSSHIGRKLSDIAQDIRIKSLIDSGMPEKIIQKTMRGKRWGWEVTVNKIFDYEKTFIFGYGNDGIGYKISFIDTLGNEFICLINTNFELEVKSQCAIDGMISEIDSSRKQIRLNRVKIIKK